MTKEIWILGIHLTDRVKKVTDVQAVLTKFGCSIKTRLGLHDVVDDSCSPGGIILLELTGNREEFLKLENELLKIDGLDVKKMVFTN
ncbi:MAG: hypothetical protein WCP32_13550 [Bacteroidota bacterium]